MKRFAVLVFVPAALGPAGILVLGNFCPMRSVGELASLAGWIAIAGLVSLVLTLPYAVAMEVAFAQIFSPCSWWSVAVSSLLGTGAGLLTWWMLSRLRLDSSDGATLEQALLFGGVGYVVGALTAELTWWLERSPPIANAK